MQTAFKPQAEVTADNRARIAFGKIGVHSNQRYMVSTSESGEILLTPLASIPQREMLIWENPALRESLERGLLESHLGKTRRRDDFLDNFVDDEDEA